MNDAEVLIKFKGNTQEADEATKKAQDDLKKLQDTGTKTFTALTLAADAFAISILKSGVSYNAEIETYLTRLETLTGSAEEANSILEQIKKDALATPFDVSSLTQAESLLLSTGLSADQVRDDVIALGDALAASGGGNAELQRMAVNMQQIKNVGKATALDIKQFAYAGIDIYGLLADSMGITREEASEMTITYDMLSEALQKASKQGGKYYKAMEKQSKTYKGAMSNLQESVSVFAGNMSEGFFNSIKKLIPKLTDMFDWLSKNKDIIIAIAKPVLVFTNTILGLLAVNKVSTAFKGLWAVLSAHPIGLAVAAVGALTTALISLFNTESDEEKRHKEVMNNLNAESEAISEQVSSWDSLKEARQRNINVGMTEIAHIQSLYDELTTLVDENGNVIDGYEARAEFITGELAQALGIELQYTNGQIQGYQELTGEIDKLIEKKKAQIILNASEEAYTEAVKNQIDAQTKLNKVEADFIKIRDDYNDFMKKGNDLDKMGITKSAKAKQKEYDTAKANYEAQKQLVEEYYYDIGRYQQNYEYFQNEEYDKMSTASWEYVSSVEKAGNAEKNLLEKNITTTKSTLNTLKRMKAQSGSDIYDQQIRDNEALLKSQENDLKKYTSTTETGLNQTATKFSGFFAKVISTANSKKPEANSAGKNFIQGFGEGIGDTTTQANVFTKITSFASSVLDKIKKALNIHSPSLETARLGEYFVQGFGVGIENEKANLYRDVSNLASGLLSSANLGLSGSLSTAMNNVNNNEVKVYANFTQDQLGQVVRDIKTFSGGARNDYNYGTGGY